jgi:hypothetical protein
MPMPHASRWIRAVGLRVLVPVGLILSLAACPGTATPEAPLTPGSSPPPGATTTPEPTSTRSPGPPVTGPAFTRVTVTRSGGIAGVVQTIRVEADGSWMYTDRRGGAPQTRGRLSDSERNRLAALLAAAEFAREARMRPPVGVCNDSFVYSIIVGEISSRYEDCGSAGERPATAAVVALLIDATPL